MNKLQGYAELDNVSRKSLETAINKAVKDLGYELYDWGGGNFFAPSIGKVNDETTAFMFVLEEQPVSV